MKPDQDPLGARFPVSDDPWSNHTPGESAQGPLEISPGKRPDHLSIPPASSFEERLLANGGASASMHAPKNLTQQLSSKSDPLPKLKASNGIPLVNELENLDLAWRSSPALEEEEGENKDLTSAPHGTGDGETGPVDPRPGHMLDNASLVPRSNREDDLQGQELADINPSLDVDQHEGIDQEAAEPTQPEGNADAETGPLPGQGSQSSEQHIVASPGSKGEGSGNAVEGSDDSDDEEAFVYPGDNEENGANEESSDGQAIDALSLPVVAGAADSGQDVENKLTAGQAEAVLAKFSLEREVATTPESSKSNAVADEPETAPAQASDEETASAPAVARLSPKPVDHNQLVSLCSSGPLSALQAFFAQTCSDPSQGGSGISSFALANEPNPSSGLVPLHYAAREGKLDIVKWLINEAGALVEMEDREGETPLHKASMAGKLPVLSFLLSSGSDANALDADGWTALHNACSRGYLDLVRVLVESAGAEVSVQGGRGSWTPLMNAASKGHLPIVRYLTAKHHADPFIRNAAGETAFDVAAATFEIYICEVLEKYEAERWNALKYSTPPTALADETRGSIVPGRGPYNPLALHTTIPIILHENQRLDTRLKTLAINGARPRWSSTSAARPHKPDRRAPWTMPPGAIAPSRTRHAPVRKEDVNLPTRSQPYKLRLPARGGPNSAAGRRKAAVEGNADDLSSTPTPQSVLNARKVSDPSTGGGKGQAESSHFWLSEWQQDLTHPLVGVEDGWQYSQSFDALDDRWSASIPPPLARLLDGRGLSASVTRAITGGATMASGQGDQEAAQSGWVRRRRWVRVMRRRLDIEFGDDLEASEFASGSVTNHSSGNDDASSPSDLPTAAVITAQEAARVECAELGPDADYVKRAQALAGKSASHGSTPADSISENRDEIARRIARLEMAITELRSSAFSDEDVERRGRAEDLLKEFTVQLGQMRQAFGLEEEDELSDLDDEEFIYPNSYKDDGASVFTRIPATNESSSHAAAGPSRPVIPQRHSSSASVFGAAASADVILSAGARSADLAASRSFRVPTNEAPNKVVYGRGPVLREQNLLPQWERDTDVNECRGCSRRFTFFVRKHHCRRCGKIFCDSCSSRRAHLDVSEMVVDPSLPGMAQAEAMGVSRICDNCNADRQLPPALQSLRGIDALTPRRSSVGGGTGAGVGSTVFGGIEHEHGDDGRGFDPAVAASDVSSRASELNECPVCSITLAGLGEAEAQEEHVRNCLENGGGGTMQGGRYLVYKLPDNSPIVGKECLICMEDFVGDNMIARLPCLCYFHRACIDSWFKKGRECPVHARTW